MNGYPITDQDTVVLQLKDRRCLSLSIPFGWFEHLRLPSGHLYANAVFVLAQIRYWHLPFAVYDEDGNPNGWRKKFQGPKWRAKYPELAKRLRLTVRQVQDAVAYLNEAGVVKREVMPHTVDGVTFNRAVYITPNLEKMDEMADDEELKWVSRQNDTPCPVATSDRVPPKRDTVSRQNVNIQSIPAKYSGKVFRQSKATLSVDHPEPLSPPSASPPARVVEPGLVADAPSVPSGVPTPSGNRLTTFEEDEMAETGRMADTAQRWGGPPEPVDVFPQDEIEDLVSKASKPVENLPAGEPKQRAQDALDALSELTADFRGLLLETELLPEYHSAAFVAYGWSFLSQALTGEAQIPNSRDCLTAMKNSQDSLKTFRIMAAVWAMKAEGTLRRIGKIAPKMDFLGSFIRQLPALNESLGKHLPGWKELNVSFGKSKLSRI